MLIGKELLEYLETLSEEELKLEVVVSDVIGTKVSLDINLNGIGVYECILLNFNDGSFENNNFIIQDYSD